MPFTAARPEAVIRPAIPPRAAGAAMPLVGPTGIAAPLELLRGIRCGRSPARSTRATRISRMRPISDQWRPNHRILVNASVRYDNFNGELAEFGYGRNAVLRQHDGELYLRSGLDESGLRHPALAPGQPPPATAEYMLGDCNLGASALTHTTQNWGWVRYPQRESRTALPPRTSRVHPSSYGLGHREPRFSATYTINPETVLRASAGRYVAPPISASVQYLALTGDDRSVWSNTLTLGFYTPFHPIPGISSAQYDMSLEKPPPRHELQSDPILHMGERLATAGSRVQLRHERSGRS